MVPLTEASLAARDAALDEALDEAAGDALIEENLRGADRSVLHWKREAPAANSAGAKGRALW